MRPSPPSESASELCSTSAEAPSPRAAPLRLPALTLLGSASAYEWSAQRFAGDYLLRYRRRPPHRLDRDSSAPRLVSTTIGPVAFAATRAATCRRGAQHVVEDGDVERLFRDARSACRRRQSDRGVAPGAARREERLHHAPIFGRIVYNKQAKGQPSSARYLRRKMPRSYPKAAEESVDRSRGALPEPDEWDTALSARHRCPEDFLADRTAIDRQHDTRTGPRSGCPEAP